MKSAISKSEKMDGRSVKKSSNELATFYSAVFRRLYSCQPSIAVSSDTRE